MAKWADVQNLVPPQLAYRELVEALRFYAKAENYTKGDGEYDLTETERDEGDRARAALRKVGAL